VIYLDNNATTPTDPEVVKAMLPYFTEKFANPSSIYDIAFKLKGVLDNSRKKVAKILNVNSNEIIFCSGGTEADNIAIMGSVLAQKDKGKHIITSSIEHKAVLEVCKFLKKYFDYTITYLPVNSAGVIDLNALKDSITPETAIVSIMLANNETGVIQPIKEAAEIAHNAGIQFHSDLVQGIGKIPVDISELGIDYGAISGHKFHGPRGIGIMYLRKGAPFTSVIRGGGHENNKRAGTENIPGIVGILKALEISSERLSKKASHMAELRDMLQESILEKIPQVLINGKDAPRVPNTLNISIKYVEGESMVFMLDEEGIQVSSGSACTSNSLAPSHVLLAMGLEHADAHGSLRFSLSGETTREDIEKVLEVLPPIVSKLRKMSPFAPPEFK